jgi:hypothetical protein
LFDLRRFPTHSSGRGATPDVSALRWWLPENLHEPSISIEDPRVLRTFDRLQCIHDKLPKVAMIAEIAL